jgi:2,5-diamino-6-(ribosylamino)-4(3H)-pyrimidinone 5'-phosphate reductase
LSTHLRDKLEKIEQILECLIQESSDGLPVIVEGKNDVSALRSLGIEGTILCAKTAGKSRLDLLGQVEEAGYKEVILLFDFDRRGREWTETVKENLEKVGVKPNLTFWNEIRMLAGREVKDVEGLESYVETLYKKTGQTPTARA